MLSALCTVAQTALSGPSAPDSLEGVDSLLGIPAGLALSTAAGLRIFVPLLLTSAAARLATSSVSLSGCVSGANAAKPRIASSRAASRPWSSRTCLSSSESRAGSSISAHEGRLNPGSCRSR